MIALCVCMLIIKLRVPLTVPCCGGYSRVLPIQNDLPLDCDAGTHRRYDLRDLDLCIVMAYTRGIEYDLVKFVW